LHDCAKHVKYAQARKNQNALRYYGGMSG